VKKILTITLAVIMAFSFVACGGNNAGDGGGTTAPSKNASTPAEAYEKYIDAKSKAFERLTSKIEEHEDLAFTAGLAILPITLVDLSLLPLTIVGMEGGEAALEMMGMGDINVDRSGDVYTITYTDPEGNTITQTCEYDAKADSMRSVISDGGKDSLIFEYVYTGDGYASQYTVYSEDSGEYSHMKSYFNDTDFIGFGTQTVSGAPDSIFKKSGLTSDFVKSDESYFILEGDVMTIFMDGETKTY